MMTYGMTYGNEPCIRLPAQTPGWSMVSALPGPTGSDSSDCPRMTVGGRQVSRRSHPGQPGPYRLLLAHPMGLGVVHVASRMVSSRTILIAPAASASRSRSRPDRVRAMMELKPASSPGSTAT